jgi:hypothetical protein
MPSPVTHQEVTPMSHIPTPAVVLGSFSSSEWLKTALTLALRRDPADAAGDALVLAEVLEAHAQRTIAAQLERTSHICASAGCVQPERFTTPRSVSLTCPTCGRLFGVRTVPSDNGGHYLVVPFHHR